MKEILTKNPFNLNEDQINWVEETFNSLSNDQKIAQLFIQVAGMNPQEDVAKTQEKYQLGGYMYRQMDKDTIFKMHKAIQENSRIPAFLAANTEAGGDGIAFEGTAIGHNMMVAATGNSEYAYKQGMVAAKELKALGGNLSFAPVVDININFQNPIANTRAYSDNADTVLEMGLANLKGTQELDVAVSVKHFPGDGIDGRDQHIVPAMNHLTLEEWMATFGKVYKGLFDAGALTTMVGHFFTPNIVDELVGEGSDYKWTPTSLNKVILNDLLREKLGFNGLALTDATTMIGMTSTLPREQMVPAAIENGCDVFLFANNLDEDMGYMKSGLEKGLLSQRRVDEAVWRILATKAKLNLHLGVSFNESDLDYVGCEEHKTIGLEVRDKSIVLVKDEQNLLPLSDSIKNIKLVVKNSGSIFDGFNPNFVPLIEKIKSRFEKIGITCHTFDDTDMMGMLAEMFDGTESAKEKYDATIIFAEYGPMSNVADLRVNWGLMGADGPKMIQDIPTMFVSLASPYHLYDAPMVKTFINAWSSDDENLDILFEKITGKSDFKGVSPVNEDVRYPSYKKDLDIW